LAIEVLEGRELPSVCLVDSLGDTGLGRVPLEPRWGLASGDLRFCVNRVNTLPGADTIQFAVTGTINLTHALPDLASDMDIQGPGEEVLTVRRNTGGNYRILTVAGGTAHVSGLTIANGQADVGGGISNQATLMLDHVSVVANAAAAGGGISNGGDLTISHSAVSRNQALTGGGGIDNVGSLALNAVSVIGNLAHYLCSCTRASADGGGIRNTGLLRVNLSTISGNNASAAAIDGYAVAFGGGVDNAGALTVVSSVVSGNSANGSFPAMDVAGGGGIRNTGDATIDSSTVSGNSVGGNPNQGYGGGILTSTTGNTLTLVNSTIAGNTAKGFTGGNGASYGGGVDASGGTVTVIHTTISANTLAGNFQYGGGLAETYGSSVSLADAVLAGNVALTGPDLIGALASSGYNLFGTSAGGSGYAPTDLLDVDALLGPLRDNGGPTQTMALLPGSQAIDSGDNTNAPDWDQRGPGYPRIVNGTIDRGAFEVQTNSGPAGGRSVLATAPVAVPVPLPVPQAAPAGPRREEPAAGLAAPAAPDVTPAHAAPRAYPASLRAAVADSGAGLPGVGLVLSARW
jgi:hypothetical protein